MPSPLEDVLDRLRSDPASTVICCDFDGTLAPIVDDPAAARPGPGAVDALVALARRYGVVAVLSGRPVDFLVQHLPPTLELRGLYGIEAVRGGVRADDPGAGRWRQVVEEVAATSRQWAPAGVLVEPKGLSLTLHYRTRPGLASEVLGFAGHQAARSGLALRPARMSVELHPPVAVDKGSCLRELASGRRAACFIGDDAGDLPAFDALDALAAEGRVTARVAVRSREAPKALLARADAVVEGPSEVVDLLRML